MDDQPASYTAFSGDRRIGGGPLAEAALAARVPFQRGEPVLIFDDRSGRIVDLDLRGEEAAVSARYPAPEAPARGPGRPRLGVVAREVTLLPRHWDWLAAQPGGASVALRRLVDAARRDGDAAGRARQAQEAAYRFLSAMAGDRPGFEEAMRALFARDGERFRALAAAWPADIAAHALGLAAPAFAAAAAD